MDNIIILKGTNVVINKDVYAYKTLVAKKGLRLCVKRYQKGDKEATLSYEGRMEIDIPVDYILKNDDVLFKEGEFLFAKKIILLKMILFLGELWSNWQKRSTM